MVFASKLLPLARISLAALALGLGVAVSNTPAFAQDNSHLRLTQGDIGATRQIDIELNKSLIVDLPYDAAEVIVSQPTVAGAIMRTKSRAIVQGVGAGDTNIFFLDDAGRTIAVLDIRVGQARSNIGTSLEQALADVIPGSSIRVSSVELQGDMQRVVLSGTAQSSEDVDRAVAIATQFAGAAENVANLIDVAGSQQVMLKVTVAEVSREALEQFGINLNVALTAGSLSTGIVSTQPLGGASNVVTASGGSLGVDIGPVSIDAQLRALERRGAVRTLAEPVLTALSGQEAEFLAGGEYPVPTGFDDDKIIFTFKEFGVKLKFTPVIRSTGEISLVVDTSVSEPTTEGGFNVSGLTIPATKERQARTSVEMRPGQTLAIAGLIQEQVRQQFNSLPGLGNIPILGALFRSRDFIHSQTELVILVTPMLAAPTYNPPALPTDDVDLPSTAEAIFLGHLERSYGVGDHPDTLLRSGFDGSVGFVLD
jgi:pilus assembly protein CpaC